MRFIFSVLVLFAIGVARGAPVERDLGRGLTYYRAASVPADLPNEAPAAKHSSVLDLRYARGDTAGANALAAWLQSQASPRTPVFVLANAQTSSALLALLARHDPASGVLVLGAASPGFAPDIVLPVSSEAERRAYDALATTPDIDSLLKENGAKVRNDEARLSHERQPLAGRDDPPGDEATPGEVPQEKAAPPPAPPIDYVLQRAVHIHRGLQALKRL